MNLATQGRLKKRLQLCGEKARTMPIQNINNLDIATQPTSSGAPAVSAPSKMTGQAGIPLDLPKISSKQAAGQRPTGASLQNLVDNINKTLKQNDQHLEFRVDADAKRLVIKLLDTETGDVIRQIPSDEMLAISRSIGRFQQGLLLKQEA